MRHRIIPDVHNHYEAPEALIAMFPGHLPVFLGDYFDSYDDLPSMAKATAEWLRYSIRKGRIHLMGNHDLPYRWRDGRLYCPGWSEQKNRVINSVMGPGDWREVRTHFLIREPALRPLLLSHAGFTMANLYGVADPAEVCRKGRLGHLLDRTAEEHLAEVETGSREALARAAYHGEHHWFNQGSRMGARNIGGPFWIDKDEFWGQLPGIDQIVGHSRVSRPVSRCAPTRAKPDSEVWCIDGGGRFAALVEGGDNGRGGLLVTPIHASGEKAGQPYT